MQWNWHSSRLADRISVLAVDFFFFFLSVWNVGKNFLLQDMVFSITSGVVTWKENWILGWCWTKRHNLGNGNPLQYSCLENPWMEEPGRIQFMGSLRVGHHWATSLSLSITKAGFHLQAGPPSREWARNKGRCCSVELNFPEQQRRPMWKATLPAAYLRLLGKNTSYQCWSYRQERSLGSYPLCCRHQSSPLTFEPTQWKSQDPAKLEYIWGLSTQHLLMQNCKL